MNPTESQDSSSPSTIPEFDENDYYFLIFGVDVHYRTMAILSCFVGFLGVCVVFALSMWHFTSRYEDAVDIVAMVGLLVFLFTGVFVHFFALLSIKGNNLVLLSPSIIFHAFLVVIEIVMGLTAIGELATGITPQMTESQVFAGKMLLSVPVLILFNGSELSVFYMFRHYLRQLHLSTAIHGNITPVLFGDNRQQNTEAEEKMPIEKNDLC